MSGTAAAPPRPQTSAALQIAAVPTRGGLNTLQALRMLRAGLLALLLCCFAVVLLGVRVERNTLLVVGAQAVPQMAAAERVRAALYGMDAEAARELAAPAASKGAAAQAYERRRTEAMRALIAAAENRNAGEADRIEVERLALRLGGYEGAVQQARDLRGRDAAGELAAYAEASAMMPATLLPAAEALEAGNARELEAAWGKEHAASLSARILLGGVTLLSLGLFLAVQVFLSRKTHRTLNPALVLAMLLTIGGAGYFLHALSAAQAALTLARTQELQPLVDLWRARSTAFAAEAERNHFLLDRRRFAAARQDAQRRSAMLATLPPSLSGEQLIAALREGRTVDGFTGFLADANTDTRDADAKEAEWKALTAWNAHQLADTRMWQLLAGGDSVERAVPLEWAAGPQAASASFTAFEQSLNAALEANQRGFSAVVESGLGALSHADSLAAAWVTAAAGLLLLGLRARFREYEG